MKIQVRRGRVLSLLALVAVLLAAACGGKRPDPNVLTDEAAMAIGEPVEDAVEEVR